MELADPPGKNGFLSRRGFIRLTGAAVAATALPGWSLPRRLEEWLALGHAPRAKHRTPFITPNDDFYLVAVNPSYRPPVTPGDIAGKWSLTLTGPGEKSAQLSYADLTARARHSTFYTFECIGNDVGGQLIGNARWKVIPLSHVLAGAPGGTGSVRSVMFEGLDDFYSSVSIERARDDYAFIAVEMNGAPLPAAHGFPARVMLPDLYGMKQPRWLRRIHLLEDSDTTSYWEKRGWGGEVPVKTMSRLDPREDITPGHPAVLTGVAFAGRRGIQKVEVSLDGGEHWQPCELVTPTRPDAWSLWRYDWPRPVPGRYTLKVRATDGQGRLQTARATDAYPDGASGLDAHTVAVRPS